MFLIFFISACYDWTDYLCPIDPTPAHFRSLGSLPLTRLTPAHSAHSRSLGSLPLTRLTPAHSTSPQPSLPLYLPTTFLSSVTPTLTISSSLYIKHVYMCFHKESQECIIDPPAGVVSVYVGTVKLRVVTSSVHITTCY